MIFKDILIQLRDNHPGFVRTTRKIVNVKQFGVSRIILYMSDRTRWVYNYEKDILTEDTESMFPIVTKKTSDDEKLWRARFATIVRIKIDESGYSSVREFAESIGVSPNTLYRALNGKSSLGGYKISLIAKALGMKPSELIDF